MGELIVSKHTEIIKKLDSLIEYGSSHLIETQKTLDTFKEIKERYIAGEKIEDFVLWDKKPVNDPLVDLFYNFHFTVKPAKQWRPLKPEEATYLIGKETFLKVSGTRVGKVKSIGLDKVFYECGGFDSYKVLLTNAKLGDGSTIGVLE